jgi:hypothetical protein
MRPPRWAWAPCGWGRFQIRRVLRFRSGRCGGRTGGWLALPLMCDQWSGLDLIQQSTEFRCRGKVRVTGARAESHVLKNRQGQVGVPGLLGHFPVIIKNPENWGRLVKMLFCACDQWSASNNYWVIYRGQMLWPNLLQPPVPPHRLPFVRCHRSCLDSQNH